MSVVKPVKKTAKKTETKTEKARPYGYSFGNFDPESGLRTRTAKKTGKEYQQGSIAQGFVEYDGEVCLLIHDLVIFEDGNHREGLTLLRPSTKRAHGMQSRSEIMRKVSDAGQLGKWLEVMASRPYPYISEKGYRVDPATGRNLENVEGWLLFPEWEKVDDGECSCLTLDGNPMVGGKNPAFYISQWIEASKQSDLATVDLDEEVLENVGLFI